MVDYLAKKEAKKTGGRAKASNVNQATTENPSTTTNTNTTPTTERAPTTTADTKSDGIITTEIMMQAIIVELGRERQLWESNLSQVYIPEDSP